MPSRAELQFFFDTNSLFRGLSPAQQSAFSKIIKEVHFNRGDSVVVEGDSGADIYFIVEGFADVIKGSDPDTMVYEHKIAELHEGDTIGDIALIDKQPRSATVRATTQLKTYSFSADDLHALSHAESSIESIIMINLATRLSRYLRTTNTSTLSERKRHQAEIVQLTNFDVVTGLPNQQLLKKDLESILTAKLNAHHALYQIEVCDYKEVCDSMGQEVGDELMVAIAERLGTFVKSQDTLYRVGPNQFLMVSANVDDENIPHDAQRILHFFSTSFDVSGTEVFTNSYVGISHYPHDGMSAETLIKHAGLALDAAKLSEPNTFAFYDIHMNQQIEDRRSLANDLHQALKDDQFELYYQPQINLKTGELVGAEALIRWTHPTRGVVSPVDFIPIVEQNGLIIPLGEWIIKMACAQANMWSKASMPVRIAINLSAIQFKHKGLLSTLEMILDQTKLDPKWIELEITEGVMLSHFDDVISKLKQLADKGFIIAIDDFGTGYSSLSYLTKLPIHKLKIDQSFVKNIETDEHAQAVIRCIIGLAKSLTLDVIAEGVETEAAQTLLLELGADEGQGYLYSKPLSAHDFEKQFLNQ